MEEPPCYGCHTPMVVPSPFGPPFPIDDIRGFRSPDAHDRQALEALLPCAINQVAALSSEIEHIEAKLSSLKAAHSNMQRHVMQASTYILPSPIRHLPTEILGLIFVSACQSLSEADQDTPLCIASVCWKWRSIALVTPHMWTAIHVVDTHPCCHATYARHSRNLPLSVSLHSIKDHHPAKSGSIFESLPRWKSADIQFGWDIGTEMTGEFRAYFEEYEPVLALESLSITVDHLDDPDLVAQVTRLAPKLHTLRVRDGENYVDHELWLMSDIPWRQIRHLDVNMELLSTLRLLSADFLDGKDRTLTITPMGLIDEEDMLGLHPFTLNLTTFILNFPRWSESLSLFLEIVIVPTLMELSLTFSIVASAESDSDMDDILISSDEDSTVAKTDLVPHTEWETAMMDISRLIQRSQCDLRRLALRTCDGAGVGYDSSLPTAQLLDLLEHTPKLERLELIEGISTPSFISTQLLQKLSEPTLLPKLTSLQLVWARVPQNDSVLTSMISSRLGRVPDVAPLSSVELGVRNGQELSRDALRFMQDLRVRGLQVTLW